VSANDRGAVTAEFMVAMPAVILVVALLGSLFQLGLARISMEQEASGLSRQFGYGIALQASGRYVVETSVRGHLGCVQVSLRGPIPLVSEQCAIRSGN